MSRISIIVALVLSVGVAADVAIGMPAAGEPGASRGRSGSLLASSMLADPNTERIDHEVGELWLTVTNWGFFGSEYDLNWNSCIFPAYSNTCYLFWGGLWLGSINEQGDTLVSTGCEGWAGPHYELYPGPLDGIDDYKDEMAERSIRPTSPHYDTAAISEQDFVAYYNDTGTAATWPAYVGPDHEPLGLEITQRSYAWSYSYSQDFVIFDFWLKNIGGDTLRALYMGLYLDADCGHFGEYWDKAQDDVTGFRRWRDLSDTLWPDGTTFYSQLNPGGIDVSGQGKTESPAEVINVAWIADASGFSRPDNWPTPDVTGTRVLRTPNPNLTTSYNWWYSNQNADEDWGPADLTNPHDVVGTPETDQQKYIILSNGYFDPDQLDPVNGDFAVEKDTRYVLSFGPVYPEGRDPEDPSQWYFAPGDSVPITLAYIGGEGFHRDAVIPNGPADYEGHYDFGDLAVNASWAYTVYDNPGVDTDGDEYFGDYAVDAFGDTTWLTGDGVPDFRGPDPPPAPAIAVLPG
ncbi:hypothetical protein AMJ82_09995, partial [candidate division TA06 bacterium SM23_40]